MEEHDIDEIQSRTTDMAVPVVSRTDTWLVSMPVIVGLKRHDYEYAEVMFTPSGKAVRRCVDGENPDVRLQTREGQLIDLRQITEYGVVRDRTTKWIPVEKLFEQLKARKEAFEITAMHPE